MIRRSYNWTRKQSVEVKPCASLDAIHKPETITYRYWWQQQIGSSGKRDSSLGRRMVWCFDGKSEQNGEFGAGLIDAGEMEMRLAAGIC